eukprot:1645977-Pyramimonas_sp.AAC.1
MLNWQVRLSRQQALQQRRSCETGPPDQSSLRHGRGIASSNQSAQAFRTTGSTLTAPAARWDRHTAMQPYGITATRQHYLMAVPLYHCNTVPLQHGDTIAAMEHLVKPEQAHCRPTAVTL